MRRGTLCRPWPPFHATLCHCADCRRISGAPVVGWFSARARDYRILAGAPRTFASSPGVQRSFCPHCGTPLTYKRADLADELDITLGSLDRPQAVPPQDHTQVAERLDWLVLGDALPRFDRHRP